MKRNTLQNSQRLLAVAVGAIALTSCGGLNNKKIAEQIQQDITSNGGTSLKAVTCPSGIKPEAGKSFECVGEVDNGYTFTIVVQQQDTKGNVAWDVPHAKGLINLAKLESLIQESLNSEIGTQPSIACGGIYKALNPGESFECQVTYKITRPPAKPTKSAKGKPAPPAAPVEVTQTEKVNVTTDDKGNISWQRILPSLATN